MSTAPQRDELLQRKIARESRGSTWFIYLIFSVLMYFLWSYVLGSYTDFLLSEDYSAQRMNPLIMEWFMPVIFMIAQNSQLIHNNKYTRCMNIFASSVLVVTSTGVGIHVLYGSDVMNPFDLMWIIPTILAIMAYGLVCNSVGEHLQIRREDVNLT